MKNIFFSAVIFLSVLCAMPGQAGTSPSEWRLVKKTWLLPGDAPDIYEYKYDGAGRVTEIRNLSGKTLKNIEKDFAYDSNGKISRSSLFIKGSKLYTYEFTYDDKGRLAERREISHDVNGGRPDKVSLTRSFRYEGNKIIESKGRASFGGKLTDETVYKLDAAGNVLSKKSNVYTGDPPKEFRYGAYQNKPGLMAYTGDYSLTDINSPSLGDEGSWEGDAPVQTQYTFNTDGLVSKQIITYTVDGRKYPHTYNYTYVKLKP